MARYPKGSKVLRVAGGYEVLVDAWAYPILARWKWYGHKSRSDIYARGWVRGKRVFMHTYLLMGADLDILPGYQVDHRDRNTMNNMVSNLRVVTPSENARNRRTAARRGA